MSDAQQPPTPPQAPGPPPAPNRLYRSRSDRILGGVAAGLAVQMNLDPSLVRIGWVLLAVVTGGIFGLIYIVMWVIVPEEPGATWPAAYQPPEPGAMPGWQPPAASQPSYVAPPPGSAVAGPAMAATDQQAGTYGQPAPAWTPPPAPPASAAGTNIVSVVIGLVLIVVGGVFLLEQVFPQIDMGNFWPLIPIVIGGALLYVALRPRAGA